jgi:chaperonin GroEL
MCENAGESFDLISQQLYEDNVVWDFTNEEVVDAFEAGILDPIRVTKNAILNAVSVAGTLITTDYAIVEG